MSIGAAMDIAFLKEKILKLEEELNKYKEDEKNGILIRLPCPIGTKIYLLKDTRGCSNCSVSNCDGLSCRKPSIRNVKLRYDHLDVLEDISLTEEEAIDKIRKIQE